MTPQDPAPADAGENAAMQKYGITRTVVERFCYREFRYATLDHAIAQAQRDRASGTTLLQVPGDEVDAKGGAPV